MSANVYYIIEVNIARKGAEPYWHDLCDDAGVTINLKSESAARAVLAEEGRGDNARIMRFAYGIGKALK